MNHNSLCPRARQRAGADASEARRDEPAPPNPPRETQRSVPGALLTAATMVGAVLATAALLAGCASSAGVAPSSHTLLTPAQVGASADAAAAPWPASQWRAAWGAPELSALIE